MNVVSLFSGVGGFELGFEQTGFKTVFQCENDKYAQVILEKHWPNVPRFWDIEYVSGLDVVAACSKPDVVVWGSPCQNLSVAGKREGIHGRKSGLFKEGVRVINEIRKETAGRFPRACVWENVEGALSSNKGADFRFVLESLADAGALVLEWCVLDARCFGLPQARKRVFVAAVFDSAAERKCSTEIFPFTESSCGHEVADGHFTFYTSQGKQDQYSKGFFSSLKTAGISCVVSENIKPRKLTPVECERLMGWPDDWTSGVSDSQRYKQCGNGVAGPMARWVGEKIKKVLE